MKTLLSKSPHHESIELLFLPPSSHYEFKTTRFTCEGGYFSLFSFYWHPKIVAIFIRNDNMHHIVLQVQVDSQCTLTKQILCIKSSYHVMPYECPLFKPSFLHHSFRYIYLSQMHAQMHFHLLFRKMASKERQVTNFLL